jgi:hypothetical protein
MLLLRAGADARGDAGGWLKALQVRLLLSQLPNGLKRQIKALAQCCMGRAACTIRAIFMGDGNLCGNHDRSEFFNRINV